MREEHREVHRVSTFGGVEEPMSDRRNRPLEDRTNNFQPMHETIYGEQAQ